MAMLSAHPAPLPFPNLQGLLGLGTGTQLRFGQDAIMKSPPAQIPEDEALK